MVRILGAGRKQRNPGLLSTVRIRTTKEVPVGKKGGVDKAMINEILARLPPEAFAQLENLMFKAETPEDLVAFLSIGPCPKCGNELTMDGDDADGEEGIGDPTIGVCPDCGHRWCLECKQPLESWPCPHWEAWDTFCKKKGIFKGEDGCREEGYEAAFHDWLQKYMASIATSEKTTMTAVLYRLLMSEINRRGR